MKNIYTLVLILIGSFVFSQTPGIINYQGVARDVSGTPIVGNMTVKVVIHSGSAGGPAVLTETYNPTVNLFGIFEIKIGSQSPGVLTNIPWGTNFYYLGVSIDPNGGANFGTEISNQQLVSVPYALYAEKAGNAMPTSITSSSNVIITSTGTNSYNLNVPQYFAGSNVTLTSVGNNYLISAGTGSAASISTTWTNNILDVILINNASNVGIGTNVPNAKLDVIGTGTNTGIKASSTGANGIFASTTSTNSSFAAVYGNNNAGTSGGAGVMGITGSANEGGVRGQNLNDGPGVHGINNNASAGTNAHGVYGETNSSFINSAGVYGANFGVGPGVYGWQGSTSGGPAIQAIANSTVNPAIYGLNNNGHAGVVGEIISGSGLSTANGVVGKTNSTNPFASGVYGQNTGSGYGAYGLSSSTLLNGYGVYGKSIGGSSGVYGETSSSFTQAGGVSGYNSGTGPGVKASLPTGTVAGGMNAALVVDNGHIKSAQPNPPVFSTYTLTGGPTGVTFTTTGCTDVKGSVLAVCTTTGLINIGGQVGIKVNFIKPYSVIPTVVVTPASDFGGMSYYVTGVTTTFFEVYLKNNTPGNLSGAAGTFTFNFNYMVME